MLAWCACGFVLAVPKETLVHKRGGPRSWKNPVDIGHNIDGQVKCKPHDLSTLTC